MKTTGKLALAALALTVVSATAETARAQSLMQVNYPAAAKDRFGFTLFPPGPQDRLHIKMPARKPAAQSDRPGRYSAVAFKGAPTRMLKQLIGHVDAGIMDHDAVQYGARIKPARRPTQMTIREIYDWIDRTPGQPHAIGRYQFIPKTLRSVVRQAGISHDTVFSAEVQDRLADILLADAGMQAFLDGDIGRHRFMNNLARIWAAFPNSSGRSHYHGYAGNRAVISWAEFDFHMKRIFNPGGNA